MPPSISESLDLEFFCKINAQRWTFTLSKSLTLRKLLWLIRDYCYCKPERTFSTARTQHGSAEAVPVPTPANHRARSSASQGQENDFLVCSPTAVCKQLPIAPMRVYARGHDKTPTKAQVLKVSTGYLRYCFMTFGSLSRSFWKPRLQSHHNVCAYR